MCGVCCLAVAVLLVWYWEAGMTQREIIESLYFQIAYWMFIWGVSIALTGFILGLIVVIRMESQ